MTLFFLIRHGETDWSLNEKYHLKGEYRDLPSLTQNGINQAKELANDPRLRKAEFILSSPYTRALQTAAVISRIANLDIAVEYDLREWQPDINLEVSNLKQLKNAIDDYENEKGIHPLGITKSWESKSSLKERVSGVLNKYLKYDTIGVVTHEQVIKSLQDVDKIPFCKIYELIMN
ncbi:MAG: histidine phosphatase family protein [Janthinobacterium lividum]